MANFFHQYDGVFISLFELPAVANASSFYFIASLLLLFAFYLFADVWALWKHTQGATKNQYVLGLESKRSKKTILRPSPRDLKHLHVQWVATSFSLVDCLFYVVTVALNFQLNNLWRLLELCWKWPSPSTNRAITAKDVYTAVMNTSLHMWITIAESGAENLVFENVMLPIGRNGWRGGTGARVYDRIEMELDHNSSCAVGLRMTYRPVSKAKSADKEDDAVQQYSESPVEMLAVLAALGGVYVHAQVHLIGAEIGEVKKWPLARAAAIAMNGLNFSVSEDWSTRNLLIGPFGPKILQHNVLLGTPHFSPKSLPKCLGEQQRSPLFNAIQAAHRHPVIRKYCVGHFQVAALVTSALTHSVEHYVISETIQRNLDSQLLDSNFTILRIFAASMNADIVFDFSTPRDEVGRTILEILDKHAPHLVPGFRYLPNN